MGAIVITVSDPTLRRLAWAVWWFFVAMVAVGVPLIFIERSAPAQTWGTVGTASDLVFTMVIGTFPLVGLLILRRQPRNTIGWLLQGIGLVWGLSGFADNYATYGLVTNPGSLPGADVVAAMNEGSWAPGIGLMGTFLILLFPNGHLPTPRWRPVAWLCGVTIVMVTITVALLPGQLEESPVPTLDNPIALETAAPVLTVVLVAFLPLLPLCIIASAVGLVRRFRRSHGVEREQLKWLTGAGGIVAVLYLAMMVATALTETVLFTGETPWWVTALQTVGVWAFVLLPVAIGIAILRHRLYDIDLVINRALVYGSLTATLAVVYLGSVLLLQVALSPLTDQSDLAVAGSTLAVAALFGPARRRIQATVDRRFYRRRYDATLAVDAFAGRLRHQVDLDAVGTDLRTAVDETVQPLHVSLWVRPGGSTP